MRRRENLSRKTAANSGQVHPGGPSSSGSVYAQSAPPRPSFVNELMPDWLKERKKEQENRPVSPAALNSLKGTCKTELPVREDRMDTDTEKGAGVKKGAGSVNSDTPDTPSGQSAGSAAEPEQLDLFDGKLLDPKARLKHKLIGQLFDTYWMVEYNEQLFIIDQHAAHEKVLYENTVKSLKMRQYDMQMVDPPIILTLNMNEELLLKKYMDYFTGIGFEIEPLAAGNTRCAVCLPTCFHCQEGTADRDDRRASEDMSVHNPDIIYERWPPCPARQQLKDIIPCPSRSQCAH